MLNMIYSLVWLVAWYCCPAIICFLIIIFGELVNNIIMDIKIDRDPDTLLEQIPKKSNKNKIKVIRNQKISEKLIKTETIKQIYTLPPNLYKDFTNNVIAETYRIMTYYVVNNDVFQDLRARVVEDQYCGYQLYKIAEDTETGNMADEELTEGKPKTYKNRIIIDNNIENINMWSIDTNLTSNTYSQSNTYSPSSDTMSRNSDECNDFQSYNVEAILRNDSCSPSDMHSETVSFFTRSDTGFGFKDTIGGISIYEEDEIEYISPIEGISYANMASKPRVNVPKFVKICCGTKEFKVRYESWHMITHIDTNECYCMVCNTKLQVRHKTQHCVSDDHKVLLAKCSVIDDYEDYLIRVVNDTLYHCGHCNNLQIKSDIQMHIVSYHPMKKTISPLQIFQEEKICQNLPKNGQNLPKNSQKLPNNSQKLPNNSQNIPKTATNTAATKTKAKNIVNTTETMKHLDIFGNFRFSPFGTEMVVSNLGFHTLIHTNGCYVCVLCNVVAVDLVNHVFLETHKQYLLMTPFIKPFNCNLTRAIRGSLHCLLCNCIISGSSCVHNTSAPHVRALADALGMRRGKLPQQEVKYNLEDYTDQEFNMDRYLSWLTPETREALSKIQIKNHKGQQIYLSESDTLSPIFSQCLSTDRDVFNHKEGPLEISPHKDALPISPKKKLNSIIPNPLSYIPPVIKTQNVRQGLKNGTKDIENGKCEKFEKIEIENGKCEKIERKINGKRQDEKQKQNSTSEHEDLHVKLEETILLKLKTTHFKLSNTAYQTLVLLSNGTRYCFVCSQNLDYTELRKHISSLEHIENINKNKFLSNFYGQLLRQMYLLYHCAFCNVTMSRKEIKSHLEWAVHVHKLYEACTKLNKKVLKESLKSGLKELHAETHKEHLYSNMPEPTINIVTYIQTDKDDYLNAINYEDENRIQKKNQIVILNGTMLKITFESWHGITTNRSGMKCILCQCEFTQEHVDSQRHLAALAEPLDRAYYPALVRKINENTLNCVICNIELPNDQSLPFEHINGRKHEKNYSAILEKTSQAESYSDCYKYPIIL